MRVTVFTLSQKGTMGQKTHMIPIRQASIFYTPGKPKAIKVARFAPETSAHHARLELFDCSAGACFSQWERGATLKDLLCLYVQLGLEGADSNKLHEEFMKISEYRDWWDLYGARLIIRDDIRY